MPIKKRYLFALSIGAIFFAALLSFAFVKIIVYGQTDSTVSNAAATERPRVLLEKTTSVSSAKLTAAAAHNRHLKNNLRWSFGARAQTGWNIYVPLIQHTIGTDAQAETPDFARAVAVWQRKNDLAASGAIDEETLYAFVKFWQSRRLNSSRPAANEELLLAPIADFFDPTRDAALLYVERETYAAYKRMLAAAAKDLNLKLTKNGELAAGEKFLRIISAHRSREYQEQLRRKSPDSGRAGLAVNSPHFTGRALDLYVGGEPTITKDHNRAAQVETAAYRWLVKNAERFGFYPYYYEPWHWEYVPRNLRER